MVSSSPGIRLVRMTAWSSLSGLRIGTGCSARSPAGRRRRSARILVHEAVGDRFGKPETRPAGAHGSAAGSTRRGRPGRGRHGTGIGHRNAIVPRAPGHLFHKVFGAADIHPETGAYHFQDIFVPRFDLELDGVSSRAISSRAAGAQQPVGGRNAQFEARAGGRQVRICIDAAADQPSAAQFGHQLGGPVQGVKGAVGVDAAFEAMGRIRVQPEPLGRFADAAGLK
jgi:hypothetical protein